MGLRELAHNWTTIFVWRGPHLPVIFLGVVTYAKAEAMAGLSGSFAPMKIGESRSFRILTTEPATVEIKCFVRPPVPPAYRGCPECGTISNLHYGESVEVIAPLNTFTGRAGGLELSIIEAGMEAPVVYVIEVYQDRERGYHSAAVG